MTALAHNEHQISRASRGVAALKHSIRAPFWSMKALCRLGMDWLFLMSQVSTPAQARYGKIGRYCKQEIQLGKFRLTVPDVPSALFSFAELFEQNIYNFPADGSRPVVVDIGANIGLSILYFKSIYPEAEIVAYEADPEIFSYLQDNVQRNQAAGVTLCNKAVWTHDGTVSFAADGADGGAINEAGNCIPCEDVRNILTRYSRIDFLKMDIEGAENTVYERMDGHLSAVRNCFIEYHSAVDKTQKLGAILEMLTANGFRYKLFNLSDDRNCPLLNLAGNGSFDLQVNIFAWKN